MRRRICVQYEGYISLYEAFVVDVNSATQSGINAEKRANVGYAHSPALTEAASLFSFWRNIHWSQRTNIGLSDAPVAFGTKLSLPMLVPSSREINTHLHEAWANLRKVQNEAEERRLAWLHVQVDAASTTA